MGVSASIWASMLAGNKATASLIERATIVDGLSEAFTKLLNEVGQNPNVKTIILVDTSYLEYACGARTGPGRLLSYLINELEPLAGRYDDFHVVVSIQKQTSSCKRWSI